MAAFKAANPGAVLVDFLAWRAPSLAPLSSQSAHLGLASRDHEGIFQEQASPPLPRQRRRHRGAEQRQEEQHQRQQQQQQQQQWQVEQQQPLSAWAALWDSTAPCTAWEQKDLQVCLSCAERCVRP